MAKILVADDNSNVQKTVALALAELGVEVVAVNNGEAAVRKLADFSPDLVLADIFMPVRNGYEVCEYIKKDARFSQVPVVLLVGAFDPLDEREAQRVGADGILKKPFVPPDPLITMVKTLLERAMGERLVAVAVSKPVVAVQAKTETVAVPNVQAPVPQTFEDLPELQPPPPVRSAEFDSGERPVAFGQLLETAAPEASASATELIEPVDNEQVLTSHRDANLGDPIFWRNDEPESEQDSESRREEDGAADMSLHSWKQGESSLSLQNDATALQPIEPLELIREGSDESSQSIVASGSILLDAAAQAPLTVDSATAEDLAANPIEWMATAPEQHASELPAEIGESKTDLPEPVQDVAEAHAAPSADLTQEHEPNPAVDSTPAIERIPPPVPDPVVFAPIQASEKLLEKTSDPGKTQPSIPAITPSVEDTARSLPKHDWADLTAVLKPIVSSLPAQPAAIEPALQKLISSALPGSINASSQELPQPVEPSATVQHFAPQSGEPENKQGDPSAAAQPSSADLAMVEAVVQRVLDKMRPQVVEIITKEFLRPIVQALVHREITKP